MKYLSVAEKHDAAKTISALLSNGSAVRREGYSKYNKIFDFDANVNGQPCKMVMTSVSGHLLNYEFPTMYRKWQTIAPEALFDAPVLKTCKDDYLPIKRTLEREIRGCKGLIIWTDCDREGENIGFEISEVCRAIKPGIVVYRAIFSEITSASVKRALQHLNQPNKFQSDAVDVRSEMDLRTGAVITRLQTMRLQKSFPNHLAQNLISYGSCQIPTLGFVVERYKEVEAFKSEPFWKIDVTHTIDDLTVEFTWARNRFFDKDACENYLLLCLADPRATVESVVTKPKSKWRPKPLDTVEMEKLCSRKLKLSAKEAMSIAEKLYTKGFISYPRTETNQFSSEIDLKSLVEQQTSHSDWGTFADRVLAWGPNPRNGKKTDQAHPPIYPTKLVTGLQGNEARVYELICRHFLACVSRDAIGSETVVQIKISGEQFSATGLCIFERNYLDVYIYEKWNAKQIHNYQQGEVFTPTDITMEEGATSPPALLTEADLITLMEKYGIGTDATHAEHINTIKERGYIGVVNNGLLVPGVIGIGLCEAYDAMQVELARPVRRAQFEEDLKKICLGEKLPAVVIREQIEYYKNAFAAIKEQIRCLDEKFGVRLSTASVLTSGTTSNASVEEESFAQNICPCPKCSAAPLALMTKKKRPGHFIGCLNYPTCQNVIWLPDECNEPVVLPDESCRVCGPEVKLFKFKLTSSYYKALFQSRNGWYKGCLRCDRQLQEFLNINLDSVKNVGSIVSLPTSRLIPKPPKATTQHHQSQVQQPQHKHQAQPRASVIPSNALRIEGQLVSQNNNAMELDARIPNEPVVDLNIDDMFADDDLLLDCVISTENASNNLQGAFQRAEYYNWGSRPQNTNNGCTSNSHQRAQPSSTCAARTDNENTNNQIKCNCDAISKRCTVQKPGPNTGRFFYTCAARACNFFQWADSEHVSSAQGGAGPSAPSRKCSLCRQPGHTKPKCPRNTQH